MPSGRTHDKITLWSLPVVAAITFERTRHPGITLLLAGGYLFSGLMFGPDLDIYSRQYQRWGPLRWIWLPYRHSMRHRSVLSHGPLIGTVGRVIYLLMWIGVGGLVLGGLSAIAYWVIGEPQQWWGLVGQGSRSVEHLGRSLQHHWPEWFALLVGLELGAMSHALSDWVGSAYKRRSRQRKPKATLDLLPTSPPPPKLGPPPSPNPATPASPHRPTPPKTTAPKPSRPPVELPPVPPAWDRDRP